MLNVFLYRTTLSGKDAKGKVICNDSVFKYSDVHFATNCCWLLFPFK